MSYRNAPEAIEWLCNVFGFQKHAVFPGANNTILHAELTLDGGMIMLGSTKDGHPVGVGGSQALSLNLIVDDADAVYARAKAAGAEILNDIEDKPQGGRGFTCRDLEGRAWNVGTYDPWQPK
jgi:uncharacterized glyoxalase superfamily protein PhnB